MQEVRCGQCQRKLAMADFVSLDIKCPRCGTLNMLRAEAMATMKGRVVVSVNDIPQMREVFAQFKFKRLSISYTVGTSSRAREPKGEMLITNFDPA